MQRNTKLNNAFSYISCVDAKLVAMEHKPLLTQHKVTVEAAVYSYTYSLPYPASLSSRDSLERMETKVK